MGVRMHVAASRGGHLLIVFFSFFLELLRKTGVFFILLLYVFCLHFIIYFI